MNKIGNVLWGLAFILVGIIVSINVLGIADINIFFSGWWTLFIIVPCFIGLFKNRDKTGSIIGLFIGVFLLLAAQDIVDFELVLKLMLPLILVIIGVSLIFKDSKINAEIQKLNQHQNGDNEYWATFAAQNINFDNEKFNGANLTAIFGAVKCDIRKAIIKEDQIINVTAIFGGVKFMFHLM